MNANVNMSIRTLTTSRSREICNKWEHADFNTLSLNGITIIVINFRSYNTTRCGRSDKSTPDVREAPVPTLLEFLRVRHSYMDDRIIYNSIICS